MHNVMTHEYRSVHNDVMSSVHNDVTSSVVCTMMS